MNPTDEYFEERAAIMEYDGGMSREEAERLAKKQATSMDRKELSKIGEHFVAVCRLIEKCDDLDSLEDLGKRIAREKARGEWDDVQLNVVRSLFRQQKLILKDSEMI